MTKINTAFFYPTILTLLAASTTYAMLHVGRPRPRDMEDIMAGEDRNDPKPGTVIQLPEPIKARGTKNVVLLFLGTCSECSAHSNEMKNLILGNIDHVWLVGFNDKIEQSFLPTGFPTSNLPNAQSLYRQLNINWAPRMAILSGDGKLIGLQKRGETGTHFILRNWR